MAYSYVFDYKFFNWCMAENVLLQAELGKSFSVASQLAAA